MSIAHKILEPCIPKNFGPFEVKNCRVEINLDSDLPNIYFDSE